MPRYSLWIFCAARRCHETPSRLVLGPQDAQIPPPDCSSCDSLGFNLCHKTPQYPLEILPRDLGMPRYLLEFIVGFTDNPIKLLDLSTRCTRAPLSSSKLSSAALNTRR